MILLAAILSSSIILSSCSKDEAEAPTVTAPTATTEVEEGLATDVTFSVSVLGGYASGAVAAQGGTAAIKTEPADGATSGNVVVTFTASNTPGAASVTLTVTDENQKTHNATALLTVKEEVLIIPVNGNITSNTTWKTGKTYILKSRIAVMDGVTLTIEPGVVVKGEAGNAANATALIVAQGGVLEASGTPSQPIIFTSIADNIQPGQIESPNLDPSLNGLWGGLIVLGKAPISYAKDGVDAATTNIEGIPANDPNGIYGGDVSDDYSGTLKYISVRHGGTNIGEGNEINGLTLGGVGSATVIENIEIVSNQDDGIEWFGGTVNVKNAIVWNTGDDAIDTDQAWAGKVENIVVINPGDKCFELDGPEGSYTSTGHTIKDATVFVGKAGGLIDYDDNTDVNMSNIYFLDFDSETLEDDGIAISGYSGYQANTNGFASSAFEVTVTLPTGVALTDIFTGGSDAITTEVSAGAATVGADLTKFANWSWAAVAGELD